MDLTNLGHSLLALKGWICSGGVMWEETTRPWKCSKPCRWCSGTRLNGGLGSAGLRVALDDLRGLFHP